MENVKKKIKENIDGVKTWSPVILWIEIGRDPSTVFARYTVYEISWEQINDIYEFSFKRYTRFMKFIICRIHKKMQMSRKIAAVN